MIKVYNQTNRVNEILENGFTIKVTYEQTMTNTQYKDNAKRTYRSGVGDLRLLIKYYCGLNMKPEQIKENVKRLWLNYDEIWDCGYLSKTIRNIKNSKDFEMRDVGTVTVNKQWWNDLVLKDTVNVAGDVVKYNTDDKRVLFTLYVWCKMLGGKSVKLQDSRQKLKKDSNIRCKVFDCLKKLYWGGYVGHVSSYDAFVDYRNRTGKELSWTTCAAIDKEDRWIIRIEVPDGEDIVDLDCPGDWLMGEQIEVDKSIGICARCGKEFKKTSNRQKYCDECREGIKKEKDREKKRKKRAKHE